MYNQTRMDNIKMQEPLATQKELQMMLWRIEARGKVIPLNSKFRPEPLQNHPIFPVKIASYQWSW